MKDAGFSPAETRILMENGVVGGFSREATSELTESAVREAVSTKSKGAALGNKITTAFNRGQDITEDLKAFNLTQKQAGEAYFLAAIDEKNPILMKGSWDSFQKAGDGKSAFQVYQRGISDLNMSPEAILKGVSSDIAKLEAKIANSPNDPLFKQELKGLKEALLLLKDKHRPINSSPVQTARVAPPVKENPPIKATPPVKPLSPIKSASEVAPREARDIGSRLRLENRPEEASQYLLRASDGKRTFQDRYFFDAIEQSLKGEGTVAREVIREIHAKERNGLNDFIAEMHELGIHRDWAKTSKQKENIRRIMEEIKNIPSRERGLYTPQENMLQDMLRWTQE